VIVFNDKDDYALDVDS